MTEPSRLDKVKTMPRSYSQLNEYGRCAYAYFLGRVERVWQRPAFWLPMGTAVHEACEKWERSGRILSIEQAQVWYKKAYARESNEMLQETPNMSFWESSGPYAGPQDAERRFQVGQQHVANYIRYYEDKKHWKEEIWVAPDGTEAIELQFNIDLGGVKVRGFIDAMIEHPTMGVIPRDTKTGATPGDDTQIKTYALACEELAGIDILYGDFFMTKTGKPTVPYDLTRTSREELVDMYGTMDQGVKDEKFDPTPSPDLCRRCSVRDSCTFRMA